MLARSATVVLAVAAALTLSALAPLTFASDPDALDASIVLRAGDNILGLGAVTSVSGITLDSVGNWYAEIDTDWGVSSEDGAIVRNGAVYIREGSSAGTPPGAEISNFDDLDGSATDTGNLGWMVQISGGGVTSSDNLAVYFGPNQLFRNGDPLVLPGVPAGTTWSSILDVKANESRQLLVMGTANDPVSGFVRALVKLQAFPGGGFTQELVAYYGLPQAGAPELVEELEFGIHEFALSDAGHAIYSALLDSAPSTDRTVFLDGAVVAREGSASPVPDRPWQTLSNTQVDVNRHGDYVLTGILQGVNDDDALIELSGNVHIREGDVLPAISPLHVTALGPPQVVSPIHLGDNGNVLWVGGWSDPAKPGVRALFLNDRLLVEAGSTVIDGELIESFEPNTGGHALSDDGQTVLLRCRINGNQHAVVRINIGPWVSLGRGLAGSGGLMPCLVGAGPLLAGQPFSLQLTNGAPAAFATLVVGFGELGAMFKGGVLVPQLDLLFNLPLDASGERLLAAPFPTGAPSGLPLYCQFWVQDAGGPAGFSASNAVLGTLP
ncbi:MAG: hypothetical protein DHS20C15_30380 [Planctomycetota bacterium]|nr:MAG: hypothetical protein DHS20C15_30380 [Planctomycetota bacterium]